MVMEHLLSQVNGVHNTESLKRIDGIERFLMPTHAEKWLDPIVRTVTRNGVRASDQRSARNHFVFGFNDLSPLTLKAVERRFDAWIAHYERGDKEPARGSASL